MALVAVVFIAIASACMMLTLWFLKRGVLSVLRIFHEHNAIGEENARSFHELGIRPKTFADYFNPGLRLPAGSPATANGQQYCIDDCR